MHEKRVNKKRVWHFDLRITIIMKNCIKIIRIFKIRVIPLYPTPQPSSAALIAKLS